jgi:effector-binding domain-containing protein
MCLDLLYHHPARRDLPMHVDFGVEVSRPFESAGDVYATETPAGMVAVAVHGGAYDRMKETHDAIHAWREANNQAFAGTSWEIYGDSPIIRKLSPTAISGKPSRL